MVTDDKNIKILDFGTSRDMENPNMEGAGTGKKGK